MIGDVRYWHKADMSKDAFNFAFGGKADLALLAHDPKRT